MLDDEKKRLIERYFDSELDETNTAEAMELIEQYEDARLYYEELKAMAEQADKLMLDGSDDFFKAQKDSILDRIGEVDNKKIISVKAAGNRRLLYGTLAVAASLILVGVVTVYEIKNVPDLNSTQSRIMAPTYQTIQKERTDSISAGMQEAVGQNTKGESYAAPQEAVPPAPAVSENEAVQPQKPAAIPERRSREQLAESQPVPAKKLEPIGSNLLQQPTHHDEITLEQGMAALDRGAAQEAPDRADAQDLGYKEGVGIKPEALTESPSIEKSKQTLTGESTDKSLTLDIQDAEEHELKPPSSDRMAGMPSFEPMAEKAAGDIQSFAPSQQVKPISIDNEYIPDSLAYWSHRLDSLENVLAGVRSPHYTMAAAKANRGETSSQPSNIDSLRFNYAEAIYKTALLAPDSVSVAPYLDKLSRLKDSANDSLAEAISRYMSQIESIKK